MLARAVGGQIKERTVAFGEGKQLTPGDAPELQCAICGWTGMKAQVGEDKDCPNCHANSLTWIKAPEEVMTVGVDHASPGGDRTAETEVPARRDDVKGEAPEAESEETGSTASAALEGSTGGWKNSPRARGLDCGPARNKRR